MTAATKKFIVPFSKGKSEGGKGQKELLGGKGALLCEMAKMGIDVPPGFVISTEVCEEFYKSGQSQEVPEYVWPEIDAALGALEADMGRKFGDPADPLLVSVRSGAAVSMPGMMNTVLNLGLNDASVKALAQRGGERFALDCYRRLLDMFGDVVMGIDHDLFEKELREVKARRGITFDVELDEEDLADLVRRYKGVYKGAGAAFPEEPRTQLRMAVSAVFRSWNTPRAVKYRQINKITGLRGTAVSVVAMVYGNMNDNSMTGVCFTRNPSNGAKELFGEYLVNAQGEDVVAGIRTPKPVAEMQRERPAIFRQLCETTARLETHMKNMQDIEFTVQDGRLFMLQTRDGKRGGHAALRIACDMVREGTIHQDEAILMVEPDHLQQLLHPQLASEDYGGDVVGRGLPAAPGAGVGVAAFSAARAEEMVAAGHKVIMIRLETSADDVGGMHAAEGILTARGGVTSHAAVVARGWGKPCVCGCDALYVDEAHATCTINGHTFKEGDWLSINGMTGEVIRGRQALRPPAIHGDLAELMGWVDARRKLKVKANVDTPEDARVARENGAQGIGLCRTEHMFFSTPERLQAMRRVIVAGGLGRGAACAQALASLKPFQVEDFIGLFTAMDGLPVTLRLLDPPMHEFMPKPGRELEGLLGELAAEFKESEGRLAEIVEELREVNPMLGLRGCRLGILRPDITEMQAEAIFEAACACLKQGIRVEAQIMVPLVGFPEELASQMGLIRSAADRTFARLRMDVAPPYALGTMIEVPRACLVAAELAKMSSFFSFGTNDLHQMTLGFSRDDAGSIIARYLQLGILRRDPFESVDIEGVGQMIRMAVERGRSAQPGLEIGVCGEHGGDPVSVAFFHSVGCDYVSCSPLRLPIARLAAAHAAIQSKAVISQ